MTYDERVEEITRQLKSKSPLHARNELNLLIKELGYE